MHFCEELFLKFIQFAAKHFIKIILSWTYYGTPYSYWLLWQNLRVNYTCLIDSDIKG